MIIYSPRKPLLLLLSLVPLVVLAGCSSGGSSTQSTAPSPPPADLTSAKPDYKLSAKEYTELVIKGGPDVQKRYEDKVFELTGKVDLLGMPPEGHAIFLGTGKPGQEVRCVTADEEPWARVAPGMPITVRGVAATGGYLDRCILIDPGRNTAYATTAEELAREAKKDPAEMAKDYRSRSLIVQGVVLHTLADNHGRGGAVILKGEDAVNVECRLNQTDSGQTMLKAMKPGDRIKLAAVFDSITEGNVILRSGLVIKGK